MGAPAQRWPPLLLLLLVGLLGQPPGAATQTEICSVSKTILEVQENTAITEPLVNISVPLGQQVTLGVSSTSLAFRIVGNQLFLNVTPDYEKEKVLQAHLECKRGDIVVTQLRVLVIVLDINDNAPAFGFTTKEADVEEDTKVSSIVIPETELEAEDLDIDDILYYTLQEVTPGAGDFFSLLGANRPSLRLDRSLDFYKWPDMTFQLLVRDTREENVEPSHTATATLVLHVLPADLRPPWFLPCTYSDGYICIQAQYRGAVPIGHQLPSPLVLSPGPIYAEDGDRAINQRIIYSIVQGNEDSIFAIDPDSGNLTMARSVPSPKTFVLLVKGEQADHARYSVTQVTVEAGNGSLLRFPQSLYHGLVALGSGVGVAVQDAANPSQPLRIQAQDPEFPDLTSAITYRITNHSDFQMAGEAVLTAVELMQEGVFYAEVEAKNTMTLGTATTVAEIRVSAQEQPPGPSTSPDTGGTPRPPSSSTSAPGPSQAPSTTSGGTAGPPPGLSTPVGPPQGGTSTSPPPSTPGGGSTQTPQPGTSQPKPPTLGPSTSPPTSTPGGGSTQTPQPGTSQPKPPTLGTSTSPQPSTPGGGSTQTTQPGTPQPKPPTLGTSTSPQPSTPGGGSTQTPQPGTSQPKPPTLGTSTSLSSGPPGGDSSGVTGGDLAKDRRFSVVDMAALGGVLGALLLLSLLSLAVLIYKHHGHRLKCCSGKAPEPQPRGFDNQAFLEDQEANWVPAPDPKPGPTDPTDPTGPTDPTDPTPAETPPTPSEPAFPEPLASPEPSTPASPVGHAPASPVAARAGGSPTEVRSILTKERRPEGGYKAVWFGEDIGAEADVVVLNAPTPEGDGADDSGSEGSGDEDADSDRDRGPHDAPGADTTYI